MFTIALACELLHMHICQLSFFMGKIEHLYGYFKNEPAIIPFFSHQEFLKIGKEPKKTRGWIEQENPVHIMHWVV